ncbi:MAG TPA: site-2 protease family protein [Thermoanaerobaculia bacterium]|nr:site-2 protease family protein [Thermoanaerobaculia bacterium]
MFRSSLQIFRLFGFPIRLDPSWVVVAILITWTLATAGFPLVAPGLAVSTYWWMGLAGALGLFTSVVLHELAHALTARRYGIPIRGITLFFFGGVAEMAGEPPTARSEFFIAIAGPVASLALAAAAGSAWVLGGLGGLEASPFLGPLLGVIGYLATMNAMLAAFNLIPAFPLDGGRILRSLLWSTMGDLRRSTRIASGIGSGFGILLIGAGIWRMAWLGDFVGGIWWGLLGLFVRHAARESWRQLRLRQTLEGQPVRRFMDPDTFALARGLAVSDVVRDHVSRHPSRLYPVVDNNSDRLIGSVTVREIHQLPREEWDRQTLGAILQRCGPENTVPPQADALRTLAQMNETGVLRLMVTEGERLLGILSMEELLRFHLREEEAERLSGTGHPAASGAGVAIR